MPSGREATPMQVRAFFEAYDAGMTSAESARRQGLSPRWAEERLRRRRELAYGNGLREAARLPEPEPFPPLLNLTEQIGLAHNALLAEISHDAEALTTALHDVIEAFAHALERIDAYHGLLWDHNEWVAVPDNAICDLVMGKVNEGDPK